MMHDTTMDMLVHAHIAHLTEEARQRKLIREATQGSGFKFSLRALFGKAADDALKLATQELQAVKRDTQEWTPAIKPR